MKQLLPLLLSATLLSVITHAQGNKTTANASRMIASGYYGYDGVKFYPTDSNHYVYSGDRGGDPKALPKADTGLNMIYDLPTTTWKNKTQLLETFDAHSNVLSYLSKSWDAGTSSWKNSSAYYITYTTVAGKDLIETQATQSWDAGTSSWKNSTKYRYIYNADGTQDTIFLQSWDVPGANWKNSKMGQYIYDATDKTLTDLIEYNWNSGASKWDIYRKTHNQYDANLNLVINTTQNWNSGTSTWVNVKREVYTYDASKNKLTTTAQDWDAGTSTWKNNLKTIYTYNSSNVIITEVDQNWDNGTSAFINNYKYDYTLDGSNNVLQELYSTWSSGAWKQYLRSTFTYNGYNQMLTQVRDRWNNGGFWEFTINDFKRYYYYEEYTLGVKEIAVASAGNLNVYPNPANNIVNINMQWAKPQAFELLLVNNMGQVVRCYTENAQATYARSIPVSELQNGIYHVVLKGENSSVTKTIIIEK